MASKDTSSHAVEHRDDTSIIVDPLDEAIAQLEESHQFLDRPPREPELLGSFSVACLFLNRTIGSGIYNSPATVLHGTRSLGVSLMLWVIGAILALCSLLVWLEFGLSIPVQRDPTTGHLRNVPRSGGEKNFLEYVYRRPKLLAICTYGIMFLILGNLAGNAIYIGQYTMQAAGREAVSARYPTDLGPADGAVVGIAIFALTLSVLMHVFSRRGGIILNNIFAVVKVCLLIVVIVLGFINLGYARAGEEGPGSWHTTPNLTVIEENFAPARVFKSQGDPGLAGDGSSIIGAFLYVTYAFSGFYQVFYVLGEVATPRKTVPRALFFALGFSTVLFILINISYFLVLPASDFIKDAGELPTNDLAGRFFVAILGEKYGEKAMCSLLVISVFGNVLTMSFVAGRVKQEIAKEGILPFSRFFAKANETPFSWLKSRFAKSTGTPRRERERAPITGLFLHWITTMVCIIATSWMRPGMAYNIWVTLYGFSIRLLITAAVSGGLIYLKLRKSCGWKDVSAYNCGILPAAVTFCLTATVFWAGFAKPVVNFSPVKPYWVLPLIALSSLFWGMLWWCGLRLLETARKEEMVATRTAFVELRPNGEYVQVAEVVDIEWRAKLRKDLESSFEFSRSHAS